MKPEQPSTKPRGGLSRLTRYRLWIALFALVIGSQSVSPARASACAEAARTAELHNGIPSGLLAAIGHVESGGWGWSVNGNGSEAGRRFDSVDEAELYAQGLLAAGRRMIDLGCFQVDLLYHPGAFRQWQDAFDSELNAEAAAGILNRLHERTGDWNQAVALYHSADPVRGQPYLRSVMSAWKGTGTGLDSFALLPAADPYVVVASSTPIGVAVWGPGMALPNGRASRGRSQNLPRIITP